MRKNKNIGIIVFLVLQIILIQIIKQYPEFVEQFYSQGVFVYISKAMRYTFGWVPFSVGDVFYTLAGLYILRWLIINRKRIIKDTVNWFFDVLGVIALTYFAFHVLWAYNYYRLPLHKSLQIESDYTTAQLVEFTERLIEKSNAIHNQLSPNNDSLKVEIPYTKTEIFDKVKEGYTALSKIFPKLSYEPDCVKASLFSVPLTHMGFSGYLNPFTIEAQVNDKIPIYKLPTTASHEAAHQLGYAAENEANFIGAMAAMHHNDLYFKYSGYTFILRYCLVKLSVKDEAAYNKLVAKINIGILKNYEEVQHFWLSYQGAMEAMFEKTYDSFLKANNQAGGMRSYGYVVALMVNYYNGKPL